MKDSGIGMKKEFLEHLYEPFEQADNGIARKYGGTGLGMAITKNLVAIMDGTIEVEKSGRCRNYVYGRPCFWSK